jgi:hypothetical protein
MTINFTYWFNDGVKKIYPFRVGDIVIVTKEGNMYSGYKEAFKHFTGSTNPPYYCCHHGSEFGKVLRIVAMIGHVSCDAIVTYCKDRLGNDIVIDADGLTVVRQYPLRVGENTTIHLDRLKRTI